MHKKFNPKQKIFIILLLNICQNFCPLNSLKINTNPSAAGSEGVLFTPLYIKLNSDKDSVPRTVNLPIWHQGLWFWWFPLILMYFTGPAVLAGLGLMVLMIPANAWLIRQNRRLRITQMKYKDERIKTMNEVFSGVKVSRLLTFDKESRS